MRDPRESTRLVSEMNDRNAARLFRAVLIMNTITGKMSRLMELTEDDYIEIKNKIEQVLKTLKED